MRRLLLPVASLLLVAASPLPKTYDLRLGSDAPVMTTPTSPAAGQTPPQSFDLAPTPNRELAAPAGPAASNDAYVTPGLFTRGRQTRGDGFLSGSTAQEEQQRRVTPGAGFNLTMPLQK